MFSAYYTRNRMRVIVVSLQYAQMQHHNSDRSSTSQSSTRRSIQYCDANSNKLACRHDHTRCISTVTITCVRVARQAHAHKWRRIRSLSICLCKCTAAGGAVLPCEGLVRTVPSATDIPCMDVTSGHRKTSLLPTLALKFNDGTTSQSVCLWC